MLRLYGSPLSSPTNKVIYTLNYLSMPYEFHAVNLGRGEHRKPEFLEMNPTGRVPVIVDDEFVLAESNAIIRYLADKAQSAVYPRDLKLRALVDQWLDYAVQHIAVPLAKIMFNTYFYETFGTTLDERSLQDGRNFAERNIPVLEQQLKKYSYIAGEVITLADIALISALDTSELCQIELSTYSSLDAWRRKLMQADFYQKCHENYSATFNKIMKKAR